MRKSINPSFTQIILFMLSVVSFAPNITAAVPADLTEEAIATARKQFEGSIYLDKSQSTEDRVNDLVSKMTLDEKVAYLGGTGFVNLEIIGETQPVPRLGIPKFKMTDASLGSKLTSGATLFPSFISLAATFNPELAYEWGKAVAEQAKAEGYRILLGPGVNLYRVPNCGRNFEYLGEDPFLASRLVVPYIEGVQNAGVIATIKHLVANNSDYFRRSSNTVVDERALREIYFPPYKAAIMEANSGALMTAYNLLNGDWCAEHKHLITDILRGEWGFDGLVMTDWWAVFNTDKLLASGVDIEMPKADILAPEKVMAALDSGEVTEAYIDERVKNTLRTCLNFGLLDEEHADPKLRNRWGEHRKIAEQAAEESIVLLKNEGLLPLKKDSIKHLALIGKNASETIATGGGAAGFDPGDDFATYLDAIRSSVGDSVNITHSIQINSDELKSADAVVVFIQLLEHENMDRPFSLDADSLYQIERASQLNDNVVAVLSIGGGAEMASWMDKVEAVVFAWYPGTYGSTALAKMLFGEINPSGKLPISIEKSPKDAHYYGNYLPEETLLPRSFMGWDDSEKDVFDINYAEGIYTGYRWYDTKAIEPLFPFGYGLSYTTFEYSGLSVENKLDEKGTVKVNLRIKNTGKVRGAEVVQLYVHDTESSVDRPLKELKGFKRVDLEPGKETPVEITLSKEAFMFWDEKSKGWKIEKGDFELLIGSSSRDIRLKETLTY
jgi:beta-glucosidase